MASKVPSIQEMMGKMTDPDAIELNARYQNSRDAVSWAYKFADTYAGKIEDIVPKARMLIPFITEDLNKTIEVLNAK